MPADRFQGFTGHAGPVGEVFGGFDPACRFTDHGPVLIKQVFDIKASVFNQVTKVRM
ncbi:MAG TPA: hypothetical protein VIT65_26670 [Microlunatus sp.]